MHLGLTILKRLGQAIFVGVEILGVATIELRNADSRIQSEGRMFGVFVGDRRLLRLIVAQFRNPNELLFPRRPNDHGRNIFNANEHVEKFRAGQMGKKDEIVVNLFDFASNLLSRTQA